MQPQQEKAEIIRREQLTDDLVRLTLQAPAIAGAALPGQFVMARVADGFDPLLRRPFSIHQVTPDGALRILFKVVGRGTARLSQLTAGLHLDLIGPLGRGFAIEPGRPACLVGGGIGAAPLLFLAEKLLTRCRPAEIQILLGARTRAEAEALLREFELLDLKVRVATDDGSLGYHGLVPELLARQASPAAEAVYSCGPFLMMKEVARLCKAAGRPCQVSLETMMACGVSACLGCAIPAKTGGYLHVCKEGPVFRAEEVVWEPIKEICACG